MGQRGVDTHLVVRDRPSDTKVAGSLVEAEDVDLNRYFLVRDAVPHRPA